MDERHESKITSKYASTTLMREARDMYLDDHGFVPEDYDKTWAWFPIPYTTWHYPVWNTPNRQWAIRRHDLHHVVTGYATDWRGEAVARLHLDVHRWNAALAAAELGSF